MIVIVDYDLEQPSPAPRLRVGLQARANFWEIGGVGLLRIEKLGKALFESAADTPIDFEES